MNALKLAVDKEHILKNVTRATNVLLTNAGVKSTSDDSLTHHRTLRGKSASSSQQRQLVSFANHPSNTSIRPMIAKDVTCPTTFNSTTSSCVLASMGIQVLANPNVYTPTMVKSFLYTPMEYAMNNSTKFLDTLNRSEVEHVLFVGSGDYKEPSTSTVGGTTDTETNLPFVGAAVGGSLLIMMGVAIGRSRVNDKRDNESSIPDEEYDDKLFQSIVSNEGRENNNKKRALDDSVLEETIMGGNLEGRSRSRNKSFQSSYKRLPDATPILQKLCSEYQVGFTDFGVEGSYSSEKETRSVVVETGSAAGSTGSKASTPNSETKEDKVENDMAAKMVSPDSNQSLKSVNEKEEESSSCSPSGATALSDSESSTKKTLHDDDEDDDNEEEWMTKISYVPDPNVPLSFSGLFGSSNNRQESLSSSSSSSGDNAVEELDQEKREVTNHPERGVSLGLLGGSNTKINPLEAIEEGDD